MKKKPRLQAQKQPALTGQDIFHVLILVTIPLLFGLIPTCSFGQPALENMNDVFSGFDPLPPPVTTATPAPAAASLASVVPEAPEPTADSVIPNVEGFFAPKQEQQPEVPVPAAADASPLTANPFPPTRSSSYQQTQPQQHPQQREAAISADHPFQQYWGVPNDPQTRIVGKPMTVTELFVGTRSSSIRGQLLQAYWELGGLLAIYHFRCENERMVSGAGAQQEGITTLLREQRRTAEMEFIKQQWFLAELLKQYKGRTLRESELPIPADFPLYPRYQTFADRIARTERTQYLGRMIPIQEQLIESKNGTWKASSAMVQPASQPFFVLSNQRTAAFLDLTTAIVEYNKMIAEYAMETIPPNVSTQQLVGAVVRQSRGAIPAQPQVPQMATSGISLTQYEAPMGVTAQPIEQMGYAYQVPPEYVPADNMAPVERLETEPMEQVGPIGYEDHQPEAVLPSVSPLMLDF